MPSPILRRLRDLPTFEMATGDPDPRGWAVRGGDGQVFGTVTELLVDPESQRVLYLNVELERGLPGVPTPAPHAETQILLPLGAVNLDTEGSSVFVTALRRDTVGSYPPFIDFILPTEYEEAMLRTLKASSIDTKP
ncbi:PRC-barrel domain-containing protein [Hymenobacter sp. BT559]|uniref:PRC-barrel domain-containing protein n=1 Tax=Hymenobacter sp. BT559 TaxID=2795729 RepID=UPI0018EB1D63|nr:PRC-barrel domain-containing protein [Hymenobacter sp. BT559]MBJ6143612.1 PRC-barrel domain-containing protein [Hymenobacter sp. BT559]